MVHSRSQKIWHAMFCQCILKTPVCSVELAFCCPLVCLYIRKIPRCAPHGTIPLFFVHCSNSTMKWFWVHTRLVTLHKILHSTVTNISSISENIWILSVSFIKQCIMNWDSLRFILHRGGVCWLYDEDHPCYTWTPSCSTVALLHRKGLQGFIAQCLLQRWHQ